MSRVVGGVVEGGVEKADVGMGLGLGTLFATKLLLLLK